MAASSDHILHAFSPRIVVFADEHVERSCQQNGCKGLDDLFKPWQFAIEKGQRLPSTTILFCLPYNSASSTCPFFYPVGHNPFVILGSIHVPFKIVAKPSRRWWYHTVFSRDCRRYHFQPDSLCEIRGRLVPSGRTIENLRKLTGKASVGDVAPYEVLRDVLLAVTPADSQSPFDQTVCRKFLYQ